MEGNHTFLTQTELTAHFTRVMQGEMPVPKTQEEYECDLQCSSTCFRKKIFQFIFFLPCIYIRKCLQTYSFYRIVQEW